MVQGNRRSATEGFSWQRYMDSLGTAPVNDAIFFPHVRFLELTVAERYLTKGSVCFIQVDKKHQAAIIETTVGDEVLVRYMDSEESEWVSTRRVLTPQAGAKEAEQQLRLKLDRRRIWRFVRWEEADKKLAATQLKDLAKPGEWFEVQDAADPRTVLLAEVVDNAGGIVTYKAGDVVGHVHMACERCHAVGWAGKAVQKVSYWPQQGAAVLKKATARPAPKQLFEHTAVRQHKYEVGTPVEVQSMCDGAAVQPGIVSAILNQHYFRVSTHGDAGEKTEITCHADSPFLFPARFCLHTGMRIVPPPGFKEIGSGGDDEFTQVGYLHAAGMEDDVASGSGETTPQAPKEAIRPMRHVEVYYSAAHRMATAVVIRSHRHLVWIINDRSRNKQPQLVSCKSSILFPCGFAQRHGIPLLAPKIETPPPPLFAPASERFTTTPTPVFVDRQRPFMTKLWLDNDQWLSPVYINLNCFSGPFIDRKKLATLKRCYPEGPLPMVLRQILRDLVLVTKSQTTDATVILDLFGVPDSCPLPTVLVKKAGNQTWRADPLIRVAACERASQFAGWIKLFLRCLECCPNLISHRQMGTRKCPLQCTQLLTENGKQPWPCLRASLVAGVSSVTETRVRKLDDGRPRPALPAKRGDRGKDDSEPAPKRKSLAPVDLAAKLPRHEQQPTTSQARTSTDGDSPAVPRESVREGEQEVPQLLLGPREEERPGSLSPSERMVAEVNSYLGEKSLPEHIRVDELMRAQRLDAGKAKSVPKRLRVHHPPQEVGQRDSLAVIERKQKRAEKLARLQKGMASPAASPVVAGAAAGAPSPIGVKHSPATPSTPAVANGNASPRIPTTATTTTVMPSKAAEVAVVEVAKERAVGTDPFGWTPNELAEWLKQKGAGETAGVLEQMDMDGGQFLQLTTDDCIETLGLMLGPSLKIMQFIAELKKIHAEHFS